MLSKLGVSKLAKRGVPLTKKTAFFIFFADLFFVCNFDRFLATYGNCRHK